MKKEKFMKLIEQFKKIFKLFPVTLITIIILTIFFTIVLDSNMVSEEIIIKVLEFGFIFGITSFFIESVFNEKSIITKIVLMILNIVFSALITYAANIEEDILGLDNLKFLEYLARFTCCYLISIILFAINTLYKKSKFSFNEYLIKVFIKMFKSTIICGILSFGLMLITLSFIYLLLNNEDFFLLTRVEILLIGLFYIPNMIYAFTASEDEIGKFAKVVIKYVLDGLVIIAFTVIYAYMVKLIILREVPSNQIYRISAGLFIIGAPIWTITSYFKDDDLILKINSKLPYLFIPFILLQVYSIGVRIYSYGLTPLRYVCIMLIIFEIIYLIIYHMGESKIPLLFYSLITIVVVSAIIPYINMFKLSLINQYNNLKIIKEKSDLSVEERAKVKGAYFYLLKNGDATLVNDLLSEEEKEKIIADSNYQELYDQAESIYGTKNIDELNIENYSHLYHIEEYYSESSYNSPKEVDFSVFDNFEIDLSSDKNIEINIRDLINNYINNQYEFNKYFQNKNEYIIDENTMLILDNFSLRYYPNSNKIYSYSINGYVLTK